MIARIDVKTEHSQMPKVSSLNFAVMSYLIIVISSAHESSTSKPGLSGEVNDESMTV